MSQQVVMESKPLSFREGELIVKTLESEDELSQAYQLRHRVFAERLRWVPETGGRLESDVYDSWSTSIGVFAGSGRILATVRMIHAPLPFMMENEFSACLVGTHMLRKNTDTAEITRLTVDPGILDGKLSTLLLRTTFKGMYLWCGLHAVRFTYMVVEHRLLRVVRRMGWPCVPIGTPVALPPADVPSVAAILDLEEFRREALAHRPELAALLGVISASQEREADMLIER